MNPEELYKVAKKAVDDILAKAKAENNRPLTEDESTELEVKLDEAETLKKSIEASNRAKALVGDLFTDENVDGEEIVGQAKSLGEHFVKHAGVRLKEIKGTPGASVSAPEWTGVKASTDTQVIGAVFQNPVLTQFDRTIIQGVRPRLVVADLLGQGTISGNAISYFVEGALEGAFTTVVEAGAKPQLHVVDPTIVTDSLKKIAGFIKLSDEMIEDLDFFVSEINNRLLYELARFEEAQLLNGNGVGSNVLGLLNRVGIQTLATGTVTSGDTPQDALFRAITATSTGSGLDADGLVINPIDYQNLRLAKDANKQYFGGGFFAGEYNIGGIVLQPPVWGLRTVVTAAIAAGTALVGALGQAATVYRKGGVRVESTNSHASDFTSNLVTVRAEERVALAVRRPTGLVKVTLTQAP